MGLFRRKRFGAGGHEHTLIAITYSVLADLYGVSKHTIIWWKKNKGFNPRSLQEVCDKYADMKCKQCEYCPNKKE